MYHIASVSFGKDSLAMLLLLIENNEPLDEVMFYDTGMEFEAIYNTRDKVKPMLEAQGIKYTELHPVLPFEYCMYDKPRRDGNTGWQWCGGLNRWGTGEKLLAMDKYAEAKNAKVYVGIAADETKRLIKERKPYKLFPLAETDKTEAECLEYCYHRGFYWEESGVKLYDVLDRVSCWCCKNKNLKELKGIYTHLPEYWQRLRDMQSRLDRPMKGPGKSVFDLEERFLMETHHDL